VPSAACCSALAAGSSPLCLVACSAISRCCSGVGGQICLAYIAATLSCLLPTFWLLCRFLLVSSRCRLGAENLPCSPIALELPCRRLEWRSHTKALRFSPKISQPSGPVLLLLAPSQFRPILFCSSCPLENRTLFFFLKNTCVHVSIFQITSSKYVVHVSIF